MESKKIAYRQNIKERKKLFNVTMRPPQKDTYFDTSGGRGVIPLASNTTDEDPLFDTMISLSDELDKQDMFVEANFIDFLIKKIAEIDYFDKSHEEMSKIYNNDPSNSNKELYNFGKKYLRKYFISLKSGKTPEQAAEFAFDHSKTKDGIDKIAQELNNNPIYVADKIVDIIKVLISRMKPESVIGALENIRNKVSELSANSISNKSMTGGASIGTSIAIVKNILNGKDIPFINIVLDQLRKKLY